MFQNNLLLKKMKQDISLYVMVAIPVLFILLFRYVPMVGILIGFRKFSLSDGFVHSLFFGKWVGLKYIIQFVNDPWFWKVMRNTLVISFYSIIFSFPAPIILALMLNEIKNQKFKRITQTISYIPHFISTVIIVGMMIQILSPSTGIVNKVLNMMGMDSIYFMIKPEWFRFLYIISGNWQGIGWGTIIFLASIASIDTQMYEAAEMDGAGRFKKMWHITIPGIMPTIIILLLMRVGHILDIGFEKILLMQGDNTAVSLTRETSEVIDTLVYRRGVRGGEFSIGTAIGLFKSVIGIILLTFVNRLSRKYSETSLW